MAVPTNKSELIEAIEGNYAKLIKDLASVPPELARLRELEGHAAGTAMSVGDLVAYLIGWNELVLKWHRLGDAGESVDFPESGFKWNQLGLLAQKFYADYAGLDYGQLLARFAKAEGDIVRLVAGKSDEELYGGPWYEKWTMGRMIQFNSSSPYANARGRLRKWKSSRDWPRLEKPAVRL